MDTLAPGRTRVKICGITRPGDGVAAARAGADAIGLMFYRPSPRAIPIATAVEICRALPPLVARVAVFVNPDAEEVAAVLREVPVDLVQFHGEETPEFCAACAPAWIKAIRVRDGTDVEARAARYAGARALLLDAHHDRLWGGSGTTFDWSLVPARLAAPVFLAGGLDPGNVAEAVRRVRPFAVDVSGGVESEPGVKDPEKIVAFVREVSRAAASERQA